MDDLYVDGEALNDFGFQAHGVIYGLSLLTNGLVWPCGGIWVDSSSTTSTTWSDTSSTSSTTWTESSGGIFGDC